MHFAVGMWAAPVCLDRVYSAVRMSLVIDEADGRVGVPPPNGKEGGEGEVDRGLAPLRAGNRW